MVLHLNKLKSPSPKEALCKIWLKLVQWFWRRKISLSLYLHYFVIISPWKRTPLHLNKLDFSSTKDALCSVWLKLAQWFWRRFSKILSVCICYFVLISPWKRTGALHLNKLESPSPKDALCLVWLKMAQRFLRRRFFFINVILLFSNYLPLEKGRALHLKKLESPSPKNLVEIGPVVLEEEMKNVKSLRQQ